MRPWGHSAPHPAWEASLLPLFSGFTLDGGVWLSCSLSSVMALTGGSSLPCLRPFRNDRSKLCLWDMQAEPVTVEVGGWHLQGGVVGCSASHLTRRLCVAFQPGNEKTASAWQKDRQGSGPPEWVCQVRMYFPGEKTPR